MREGIALEDEPLSQIALNTELSKVNTEILVNAKVKEVTDSGIVYESQGITHELACDTVIAALGLTSRSNVVDSLKIDGLETYVIGDAKKGRKLFNCTSEAWLAVKKINGDYE